MAYATLAQFKAFKRGFGDASSDDDALITDILARVQASIDKHCHRTFEASADTTRYRDAVADVGKGSAEERRTLYLDTDLCQITSITNGDSTTVSASAYVTLPVNYSPFYAIRLKTNSSIAWTYSDTPESAIAIVGRHAWSIEAPDDIVHWTLRLAVWAYEQVNNYDGGIDRPMVSADGILRLPMAWPKDVVDGLRGYRRL